MFYVEVCPARIHSFSYHIWDDDIIYFIPYLPVWSQLYPIAVLFFGKKEFMTLKFDLCRYDIISYVFFSRMIFAKFCINSKEYQIVSICFVQCDFYILIQLISSSGCVLELNYFMYISFRCSNCNIDKYKAIKQKYFL